MKFPKLEGKAVLSPMSGVTDVAFRALCRRYGASLTYTEFVSSAAIVRGNKSSLSLLKTDSSEKPVAVQLFGNSIEEIVEAAKLVEKEFDIIDVNCGCPAWKVIKTGAGSALLNNPEKISKFINKLASAINKPVTVKIRSGIDDKHINAVEVAKIAEDSGASAITVHGRTQKQGYSGQADWSIIKRVKESVNIPVIGNGDVFTPEIFKKRLEETNVDAIMIARGAMANPFIFKQIKDYLIKGSYEAPDKKELLKNCTSLKLHSLGCNFVIPPTCLYDLDYKLVLFLEYLRLAEKHDVDFSITKNHALQFTKGINNSSKIRNELVKCKNVDELVKLFL